MGALFHWIIGVSYTIVAGLGAASLTVYWPFGEAMLAAGLLFLAGGLLHQVYSGRLRARELRSEIRALRGLYSEIQGELARAHGGRPYPRGHRGERWRRQQTARSH